MIDDDDEEKKPTVIAHAVAGKSGGARTLAEFIEWRKLEDIRMERELAEQRAAWFEMQGAEIH